MQKEKSQKIGGKWLLLVEIYKWFVRVGYPTQKAEKLLERIIKAAVATKEI
jgi:hypothetical protein